MWGRKSRKKKKMANEPSKGGQAEQSRDNQCNDCIPAKCCMYFSVEIDEPEDDEEGEEAES